MSEAANELPVDNQIPGEPKGMQCRKCGCTDCRVTHTERLRNGTVRRRRSCRHCDCRFVTYESANGEQMQFWRKSRR